MTVGDREILLTVSFETTVDFQRRVTMFGIETG